MPLPPKTPRSDNSDAHPDLPKTALARRKMVEAQIHRMENPSQRTQRAMRHIAAGKKISASDYDSDLAKHRREGKIPPNRAEIEAEISAALSIVARRQCERDFATFLRLAWPVIEPATPFVGGLHIDAICDYLSAVSRGEVKRLIVNIPPRHGKSSLVSIFWPAWSWALNPQSRWLFASYSGALAVKHSLDRRALITSEFYRSYWPQVELAGDQNLKTEFANTARGVMTAVGIGGTVTGKGGDYIVVDDPHSALEAYSEADRKSTIRAVRGSIMTRLDSPAAGAIIVIMQRLHEQDVTGELLADGGWEHLCLQSIAESRGTISLPSGRKIERGEGELLNPQRFPPPILDGIRSSIGSAAFAGQYQQRPTPAGGLIFKPEWWRFYVPGSVQFERVAISVDAAFKGAESSDFVAIQAWGFVGPRSYLIERDTERRGFVATKHAIKAMAMRYAGPAVVIEDAANGPAIIEELRREFSVIAVTPKVGKTARAEACTPDIEAGNVYLPDPAGAPWVESLIDLAAKFPRVANDDDIDAMTQALNWRRQRAWGIIEVMREESQAAAKPIGSVRPNEKDALAASLAYIRSQSPMGSL